MTHTPGPWEMHGWADGDYEINAHSTTVCNVPGFDDDTVERSRVEANARLIAAAPELLAVLKAVVAQYDEDCLPESNPVIISARAAIAKAEGRTA